MKMELENGLVKHGICVALLCDQGTYFEYFNRVYNFFKRLQANQLH